MLSFMHFYQLAKKSVTAWVDDYAPSMGAAISYYTVFSMAPLLLIVIAVAGFVWGRDAVQGEIVGQLSGLIGKEGATGIQALIESANKPTKGLIATVISVAVLMVGATTVFAELQSALDRVWDVPAAKKASGLWSTLRARVLSMGFILGLGFLLSVSLVLSAGMAAFGSWATGLFPGWEVLLTGLNTLLSIGIATVLFAMIFKLMPQAKVGWRDVVVGALVTAVLFEIGKSLIGLYIGKSSVTSSFAAAGSLVVLLVWVYYSAQIFLLGAEFTWVYAHDHGSLKNQALKTTDKSQPLPVAPSTPGAPTAPEVPRRSESTTTTTSPSLQSLPDPQQPAASVTHQPTIYSEVDSTMPARPTFEQRALVYVMTAIASLALKALIKKTTRPKIRPREQKRQKQETR